LSAVQNRNLKTQTKDDFPNSSPLVGSVLLPGLVELELGVGGLEGAGGVHNYEVTVLGDLLCWIDRAGDLE
jgi:hypothetical protein